MKYKKSFVSILREDYVNEEKDFYVVRADVPKGKDSIISKPKSKKECEKLKKILEIQMKMAIKKYQIFKNIRVEKVTELTYENNEPIIEGRPIVQKTPSADFYSEFKDFVKKNENKIKKDFQLIVDPSTKELTGAKAFKKIESVWYKWAWKYNKNAKSFVEDGGKFGRALILMLKSDNLVFARNQKNNKFLGLK